MALKVEFPTDNDSVIVWLTEGLHDHAVKEVESASALTQSVKQFIADQHKNGVAAGRIHALLSQNKVPDMLKLPDLHQVQNYVKRISEHSVGPFTDQQLKEYCESNSEMPEDPEKPFVVGWNFENCESFYVLWTTVKLLEKQRNSDFLQCDSTFCLNWHAFPVQIFGFSDINRKFHPTSYAVGPTENAEVYSAIFDRLKELDCTPMVVLGDGSASITKAVRDVFPAAQRTMCFAHVFRRVQKRAKSLPGGACDRVMADLSCLRYARSRDEFDKMAIAMTNEWHVSGDFKTYFLDTWVRSGESWWFDAASVFVSTNNGLESANKSIKQAQTLRKKLPFASFLKVTEGTVGYWSQTSIAIPDMPSVAPELYRKAYMMSHGDGARRTIGNAAAATYVMATSTSKATSDAELRAEYEKFMKPPTTFAEFKEARFSVNVVQRSAAPGDVHFLCTCRDGALKRVCTHSVAIMCMADVQLLDYPPDAKAVPLKQGGAKRGRPSKAPKQNRFSVN